MQIVPKKIRWTRSASDDVVAHNIYIVRKDETLGYTSPHVRVEMPITEYVLPGDFAFLSDQEGEYRVGLTALDEAGNESDMATAVFEVDFFPPSAPQDLQLVEA